MRESATDAADGRVPAGTPERAHDARGQTCHATHARVFRPATVGTLLMMLAICSAAAGAPRQVIIDTDPGTDDAIAIMADLPQERVELLKKTLPTLPIQPLDLFSRGNDIRWDTFKRTTADTYAHHFPEVLDVKVNAESGVYDVAALSNWRTEPVKRDLSFGEQLGLAADAPYLVFDFWQQRLLGVFLGRMSVEIEPHDTRVLTIRPALERPQLVGISRHISGSFSVLSLDWDAATYQLRGSSQSVPGEDYTLFIHVPKGIRVAGVAAAAGDFRGLPVRQTLTGELLQVIFAGQAQAVRWTVSFRKS